MQNTTFNDPSRHVDWERQLPLVLFCEVQMHRKHAARNVIHNKQCKGNGYLDNNVRISYFVVGVENQLLIRDTDKLMRS